MSLLLDSDFFSQVPVEFSVITGKVHAFICQFRGCVGNLIVHFFKLVFCGRLPAGDVVRIPGFIGQSVDGSVFPLIFTFPASMFPVVPLMVTLSPALMMPVVPSMDTCLAGSVPNVTLSPSPIVYSVPPDALGLSVTVTLLSLALTVVCLAASPATVFSWFTLTASVPLMPSATLVMVFPHC